MNEEYLWNKTGEDAEIEQIESALKAFRYRESAPPALPSKQLSFEENAPRRRRFSFVFAFASGVAVVLLSFVFLFDFSMKKTDEAKNVSEVSLPKTTEKAVSETPLQKPEILRERKVENAPSRKVNVTQTKSFAKVSNKQTARKIVAKKPPLKLTDEEKYAYGQLMLALSITGEKLKIVQDKIQNVEEKGVSKSER